MATIITSSTQDHLEIIDIKDNILILTGGRFRIVLEANAINFDLLSEAEQDAAIYAYANLVNSLDFPLQVVIRTRQVDINKYILYLGHFEKLQPNNALREQLLDYIGFIKQLVVENTVLFKKFYVVIPHQTLEARKEGIFDVMLQTLPWFQKQKRAELSYNKKAFEDSKRIFEQRKEQLSWQFRRLGIKTTQLGTAELIRLFVEIYNPESGQNSRLHEDPEGYMTGFVKPAVR